MAKRTTVFKGSVAEIEITLKSDGADFKIGKSDSVTELKAEFYISGTYNKTGATKVTINRTDTTKCFTTDDDYTLSYHVDTKDFDPGNLCVTFTGKYVDEEHGDAEIPFVFSSEVNAEIKAVGV